MECPAGEDFQQGRLMHSNDLNTIRKQVLAFRRAREWEPFHDPKNLAEGLIIEAGELLEHFLWKHTDESRRAGEREKEQIADEMADIFVYLLYLCEEFGIDLLEATSRKIEKNAKKYPVDKARGSRKKYDEL